MADVVTSQTIQDGQRIAVMKFTNVSDGSGEAAVKKVDVSALNSNSAGVACSSVVIAKVWWATTGMSVKVDFDASTNVLAVSMPADSTGDEYYDDFSGIPNNAGSGKTGDLDFTTLGHSSGDTYVVILELIKNYGQSFMPIVGKKKFAYTKAGKKKAKAYAKKVGKKAKRRK